MRKPINLTKDNVFQYFFKHHKDSLKSLLKAFLPLPDGHKIQDVYILDPGSISRNPQDKRCIFDLRLKLNTGEWVNVEMQNFHQTEFKKRVLFYLSKLYIYDLKQGKSLKSCCCQAAALKFFCFVLKHTSVEETCFLKEAVHRDCFFYEHSTESRI